MGEYRMGDTHELEYPEHYKFERTIECEYRPCPGYHDADTIPAYEMKVGDMAVGVEHQSAFKGEIFLCVYDGLAPSRKLVLLSNPCTTWSFSGTEGPDFPVNLLCAADNVVLRPLCPCT